jgi:hypothetical protein
MERSIPAVIITIHSPNAIMAINENALATYDKFSTDRNAPPLKIARRRHNPNRIRKTPNSCT